MKPRHVESVDMAERTHHRRRIRPIQDSDVLDAVYRCTPAGTVEVAEILGVSRPAVLRHLERLEDVDRVWSKKVGPTRVWMHPRVMREPTPRPPR